MNKNYKTPLTREEIFTELSRLQKMNKLNKAQEQAQREKGGANHRSWRSWIRKVQQTQKEKRKTRATSAIPPPHSPMPLSASDKEMLCLYQNIESLLPNSPNKIIQFIGSRQGEGVSTIVRKFGHMTAKKLRKEVVIFDVSKSAPGQYLFLGITPDNSWAGILRDDGMFEKVPYKDKEPNLDICPVSPNGALTHHVFDPSNIESIWKKLRERFDLALVDSPAAAVSPAGIAISRHMDGVILVVEAESTRWPVVENVKETIKRNRGNILGVVFNKRRYYIPDFIYRIL